MELVHVDPATLLSDRNVRGTTTISRSFAASVAQHGVLTPIDADRTDEGLRIRFGHRRALAAVRANLKSVPVIVHDRDNPAGDDAHRAAMAARLVDQVVENVHREGLTAPDRVDAVAQLALLAVPMRDIAKRLSEPRDRVEAAMRVADSPVAAKALHADPGMTIEQAAVIAEFADDPDTVARLVAAAPSGQFSHVAQAARDVRERAAALTEAVVEARDDGMAPLDRLPAVRGDAPARLLTSLAGRAGAALTPAAHRKCPHAAAVFTHDGESVVSEHLCLDWQAAGHTLLTPVVPLPVPDAAGAPDVPDGSGAPVDGPVDVARDAATEQAREDAAAWRSATAVRHGHLRDRVLTRTTPPKGVWAWVAVELAAGELAMDGPDIRRDAAAMCPGASPSSDTPRGAAALLVRTAERHPHNAATAVLAGAVERDITHTRARACWARYLRFLRDHTGYDLAPVETALLVRCEQVEATSTLNGGSP